MPKRWNISGREPASGEIEEIASILNHDGIVVLPTDTIYGIHGRATSERAVGRIFRLKGRESKKSLPVLFLNVDQLEESGALLEPELRKTLAQIWPAPLTAIVRLDKPLAATAGATTIAARVPATGWLRNLLELSGPLASTSANLSGQEPFTDPAEASAAFSSEIDGIVDGGRLEGRPSTVVDFTKDPPEMVRAGDFFFTQNLWKTSRNSL